MCGFALMFYNELYIYAMQPFGIYHSRENTGIDGNELIIINGCVYNIRVRYINGFELFRVVMYT